MQQCCEDVYVEEIVGDLEDLAGVPITSATVATSSQETGSWSRTWTFYCLRTQKGDVTIRWFGESNGYYSETVDLGVVDKAWEGTT